MIIVVGCALMSIAYVIDMVMHDPVGHAAFFDHGGWWSLSAVIELVLTSALLSSPVIIGAMVLSWIIGLFFPKNWNPEQTLFLVPPPENPHANTIVLSTPSVEGTLYRFYISKRGEVKPVEWRSAMEICENGTENNPRLEDQKPAFKYGWMRLFGFFPGRNRAVLYIPKGGMKEGFSF